MKKKEQKRLSYRGHQRLKSCPSVFCADCLCPSDDRRAEVCAVCGSKNGFIGFYERIKRDSVLSAQKLRCTAYGDALSLIICAVIIGIISAVKLSQYAQSGICPDGGEVVLAVLILQIIPLIGAAYILLKGERLLGGLFFLVLPIIVLTMILTRDTVLCLLGALYLPGIIGFFHCAHQVEMYEPLSEEKSAEPAANQWKCPHCGYINGVENAECKSCGK